MKEMKASEAEPMDLDAEPVTSAQLRVKAQRESQVRQSLRITNKISEKDNMLKYEISDKKEENELIEDLLGSAD